MEPAITVFQNQIYCPSEAQVLVHLDKKWQAILANLPEKAMGSQHVDIFLKDGRVIHDVPVFNGEDCESLQPFDPKGIEQIRLHSR